ncbi:MAG TPA: acetyl-CoA carboxylase biotin carboxyl carrier protein [Myxococcaceae bacterium]|nr:acetyl-CoA carboxylase biotin carboxyl carrier protein [Myxococcaceae bacterium]
MAKRRKASLEQSSPRSAALPAKMQSTLLDVEGLRQLIELLENSDVTQLSLRRGDERLTIRRGQAAATIVQAVPPVASASRAETATVERVARPGHPAAPAAEKPGQLVTSPFVGTFYRTPGPDQPPFVELGSSVRKGQVLCIVEAMKLMNEIEAEASGTIAEVFVENGQPVDFGQPLFRIEPSSQSDARDFGVQENLDCQSR